MSHRRTAVEVAHVAVSTEEMLGFVGRAAEGMKAGASRFLTFSIPISDCTGSWVARMGAKMAIKSSPPNMIMPIMAERRWMSRCMAWLQRPARLGVKDLLYLLGRTSDSSCAHDSILG